MVGSFGILLYFENCGEVGVVFYVYDCLVLGQLLCCYMVEVGKQFDGQWVGQFGVVYDLWVLGFNGFYCYFIG